MLATLADEVEIVRGLAWPEVEETANTLEGNALVKARAVAEATGVTALADDTGLEVDALGGAPGLHTARYSGAEATYDNNVAKLLDEMVGVSHRSARFRTVVALVASTGEEVTAEGVLEGAIAVEPRGSGGFGYDPVFEVGGGKTLAELGSEEKNRLSHRARALRALAARLATDE